LNALGGAVTITMKNGFTWDGFEADIRAGSFYRAQEEVQYGKQMGNYSVYVAGTQINDGGWRVDGDSQITNFYGDVGYKANGFESHLQLTAGDSQLGAAAFTPLQELQSSWNSIYTVPQTTENKMAMLAWTGSYAYSPTLSFQGGAYFRSTRRMSTATRPTYFPARLPRAWATTLRCRCMTHSAMSFQIYQMAGQRISAKSTETGPSRALSGLACRPSIPTNSPATTTR
jgi:iron complex outermembrane receptor protein